MSSVLNNVRFSIYKSARDPNLRLKVQQSEALVKGLEGHLQDMSTASEGENRGGHEANRMSTHKLYVDATPANEDWIKKSGIYIQITHRLVPVLKRMKPLDKVEQYAVHYVNEDFVGNNSYVLSLTVRPQG